MKLKEIEEGTRVGLHPCPAMPRAPTDEACQEITSTKKINKNWASQRRSDPPIPRQQLWLKIFTAVLIEVVSGNKILAIKIIYRIYFNAECKMLAPQKEAELGLLHS